MGSYPGFLRFLKACLKLIPSKRPTPEKLLKHKFLSDYVEEVREKEYTEYPSNWPPEPNN